MITRFSVVVSLALGWSIPSASSADSPAPSLTTPWTEKVNPDAPLPEYPRPQLRRESWTNLNGQWDYAIRPADASGLPASYEGKITVPFAVESALSGAKRRISPNEKLWYRRSIASPKLAPGERLVLNFGAVNWQAEIFVNGAPLRRHLGGYDSFSIDLTDALKPAAEQEIVVAVTNPVETGAQPRGKQLSHPGGIWYTPVTGIWQTVWLEILPAAAVADLVVTPDFDHSRVRLQLSLQVFAPEKLSAEIAVKAGRQVIARATPTDMSQPIDLDLPNARAWSPADPFLYEVEVTVRAGQSVDRVHSYFGLRKVEVVRATDGLDRIFLNNHPIFLLGPLDQGWWPDGLYTAPTDEALRWDVATMRQMGFNMVRKHVKVEPARWYYHCDQLGLLVMQDMPSAAREGTPGHWLGWNEQTDGAFSPEEDGQFVSELIALVRQHRHFPSIVSWDPFNEGWGQHRTNEIIAMVKRLDPTRLVDGPSGWTDFGLGDMIDCHAYPGPGMLPVQSGRASFLGEFGGLGFPVQGHLWQTKDFWRTSDHSSVEELTAEYRELIEKLPPLVKKGLAAAVYTQLTDVEGEINGYVTYDRRVIKMPADKLAPLHRAVIETK